MTKLPKPLKLKAEKLEEENLLNSMSHFIDDRLELTKQIFATLKSKTIMNLAPDFLKKKDVDTIEEMCLDELLYLSTKRLRSIINNTKCPTDTESSSDSDVERKEEHVSLEEISSGSELGAGSSKTARNKNKIKNRKNLAAADENEGGQISVLELLELQARARAIRSQLAMEPVTKIEVDSEDDDTQDTQSNSSKPGEKKKKKRVLKSSEKEHTGKLQQPAKNEKTAKPCKQPGNASTKPIEIASKPTSGAPKTSNRSALGTTRSTITNSAINISNTTTNTTTNTTCAEPNVTKKIKLKRNFRNAHKTEDKEKDSEPSVKEVKKEKKSGSRSASPDVVPIVSEPITLCISDSDSEDPTKRVPDKQPQPAVAPEVNKENNKEATEKNIKENNKEKATENPIKPKAPVEPEEGEIMDVDMEPKDQIETTAVVTASQGQQTSQEPVKVASKSAKSNRDAKAKKLKKSKRKASSSRSESDTESGKIKQVAVEPSAGPQNENLQFESGVKTVPNFDDEDPNDDVISLGGGDLETEMTEHLRHDTNTKDSTSTAKSNTNTDDDTKKLAQGDGLVISLDSSENEDTSLTDSWHTRYLKSAKVNKVLAVSRLGKRMRDNIKSSKRKAVKQDGTSEISKGNGETFVSKHEEGSLEQYKELIELKSQNDSTKN